MTLASLDPAYVQIQWHSPFAPHVQTIPTVAWSNANVGAGVTGSYTTWAGAAIDADAMIRSLVTLLAAEYNSDTEFDRYTIYTKASPTASAVPVIAGSLGIAGSGSFTGWSEAVQATIFMRDTAFAPVKLVLLDKPTDNAFGRYYTPAAEELAIFNEFKSINKGWSSRLGYRPNIFKNVTVTLNKRLRREYHLY